MKLCVNDPVVILSGKDRGKEGVIQKIDHKKNMVVVAGLNKVIKHMKPREGVQGGRVEISAPMHISNVAYKDPKNGKPTRLGFVIEDGRKVRITKQSGTKVPPTGKGKLTSVIKAN